MALMYHRVMALFVIVSKIIFLPFVLCGEGSLASVFCMRVSAVPGHIRARELDTLWCLHVWFAFE